MRNKVAGAIAAMAVSGMFAAAEPVKYKHRSGRKPQRRADTGTDTYAAYNTEADAARAVTRAKRWLRNQSKGPKHVPPGHIYINAELAVAQFGDAVAKL